MNKKYPIWLRAIEGSETGGSAGSAEGSSGDSEKDSDQDRETNSEGSSDTTDWKALYETSQQEVEKWKSHSRKWEERAKANSNSNKDSDGGDVRERLAQVEQDLRNARAEAEEAKAEQLKLSIGAEFGISKDDVDLYLRGSEEDMRRQAQGLADRKTQEPIPENQFQGRGGQGNSKSAAKSWAKELLGKTDTPN